MKYNKTNTNNMSFLDFSNLKIVANLLINSALLNIVIKMFTTNDSIFLTCISSLYNYGPKAFLKQHSTDGKKSGSQLSVLTYHDRMNMLDNDSWLSGYKYTALGYKTWANTANVSLSTLSNEISTEIDILEKDIQLSSILSNYYIAQSYLLRDLSQINDPEVFYCNSSAIVSDDYINNITNYKQYYDESAISSVWTLDLHSTRASIQLIKDICDNYLKTHENLSLSSIDGIITHALDKSTMYDSKVKSSLDNIVVTVDNSYPMALTAYYHDTLNNVNNRISYCRSPLIASSHTSTLSTKIKNEVTYTGYVLTPNKLNNAWDENLDIIKNNISYKLQMYSDNNYKLTFTLDLKELTTYIPEISKQDIEQTYKISDNSAAKVYILKNLTTLHDHSLKCTTTNSTNLGYDVKRQISYDLYGHSGNAWSWHNNCQVTSFKNGDAYVIYNGNSNYSVNKWSLDFDAAVQRLNSLQLNSINKSDYQLKKELSIKAHDNFYFRKAYDSLNKIRDTIDIDGNDDTQPIGIGENLIPRAIVNNLDCVIVGPIKYSTTHMTVGSKHDANAANSSTKVTDTYTGQNASIISSLTSPYLLKKYTIKYENLINNEENDLEEWFPQYPTDDSQINKYVFYPFEESCNVIVKRPDNGTTYGLQINTLSAISYNDKWTHTLTTTNLTKLFRQVLPRSKKEIQNVDVKTLIVSDRRIIRDRWQTIPQSDSKDHAKYPRSTADISYQGGDIFITTDSINSDMLTIHVVGKITY